MKLFYSLTVILLLFANGLFAQTSTRPSGSGTKSDPFQIATINNLYWLSQENGYWDDYFIQTADIDASDSRNWNSGKGFSPIGNTTKNFIGSYNGKGYEISNLYFNNKSYLALFSYVNNATISNLGVVNIELSGRNFSGGLIALGHDNTISNCYVTGNIYSSGTFVGGLIGYGNYNTISKCYSNCNVYAEGDAVGGLIGYAHRSTISKCYTTGIVEGKSNCAGLIGTYSEGTSISNCYASCSVTAEYSRAGGLVGYSYTSSAYTSTPTISYCYSSSRLSGISGIGGFIGNNESSNLVSCYYDSETSGKNSGIGHSGNSQKVTALTTSKMKNANNFSDWDFSNTWGIQTNKTYPALLAVDNAPFAFAETITGSFSDLLENDYDYETFQENLILKIDSAVLIAEGIDYADSLDQLGVGDSIKIVYRAGEIRESDTLYGNAVVSYLKIPNFAPVLSAVSTVYTYEDNTITLSMDNVTASDENGDELSLVIFAGDNYSYSGTTINPTENYNGVLTVPVAVSDGTVNSDTLNMTLTVNAVNDAPVIMSKINLSATVGLLYADTVIAVDVENEDLTYSLSDQPGDMSIKGNIITWIPEEGTTTSGSVTLTVSDGTDVTTESFVISVSETGSTSSLAEENITETFNLYPNPVRDNFVIDGFEGAATLYLFDITGTEVLTQIITSGESINTDDFSKGLYVAKIKLTDSVITKSFIKN